MKTVHAVKKMLALETEDPAEKALHRKSLHRKNAVQTPHS
jgi:hypothetical protein